MDHTIATRILIISDTHGLSRLPTQLHEKADVLIHCGDLTEGSKLEEFRRTVELLRSVDAPLKLCIAGNHDWTLDAAMFEVKLKEARLDKNDPAVIREYGRIGEAEAVLVSSAADGIFYLKEGSYSFDLQNGARLSVYASPYTPSVNDWGFQYPPTDSHTWDIKRGTDIAITHGPPRGMLDMVAGKRAGAPDLFRAIAHSQPRIHCFGHIHSAWGARNVCWRKLMGELPSHFTAIDNEDEKSYTIASAALLKPRPTDSKDDKRSKAEQRRLNEARGFYSATAGFDTSKSQTLFVNAAIQTDDDQMPQLPWLIDVDLPATT